MGTHATVKFTNEDATDYLVTHTRWDGFEPKSIKTLIEQYDLAIEVLEEKIANINCSQTLEFMQEFVEKAKSFVQSYKDEPTIDKMVVLFSLKSFVHHQPVPHKMSESLFDYWGVDSPEKTVVVAKDLKILKSKKTKIRKKDTSEYKTIRIYYNNKFEASEEYIDLKFKDDTEFEIIQNILSLPNSLRDLYQTVKLSNHNQEVLEKRENHYIMHLPFFKLARQLAQFYQPHPDYDRINIGRGTVADFSTEEAKSKALEENLGNVSRTIPFDLYISSLPLHIMLCNLGKVFPVTMAEFDEGKKPDITMYLSDTGRVSIKCDKINHSQYQEMIDKSVQDQAHFYKTYGITPFKNLEFKIILKKNIVSFDYEKNVAISMFEVAQIEAKESKKIKLKM